MNDTCEQCGGRFAMQTDDQGTRAACTGCGYTPERDDGIPPISGLIILFAAGCFVAAIVHFCGG